MKLWQSQDYYKASAKKFCNIFTMVYIKNCKRIIKISKEIAQFISVFRKNSKGFTKEIAKNLGQTPGLETAHESHLSTTVMGTPGYAAPEYIQTGIYAVHLFIAFNCKIKFIQLFETEIYALCRASMCKE